MQSEIRIYEIQIEIQCINMMNTNNLLEEIRDKYRQDEIRYVY